MIHPECWSLLSIYYRLRYGSTHIDSRSRKWYATLPVEGKTVLDIGGYNGDSAKFFLNRGARRVIVIECDKVLADRIDMDNVEVINDWFKLDYLYTLAYDVFKCDIEGYEELLLHYKASELKPGIIEVHGQQLIDHFVDRGWRVLQRERLVSNLGFVCNY